MELCEGERYAKRYPEWRNEERRRGAEGEEKQEEEGETTLGGEGRERSEGYRGGKKGAYRLKAKRGRDN